MLAVVGDPVNHRALHTHRSGDGEHVANPRLRLERAVREEAVVADGDAEPAPEVHDGENADVGPVEEPGAPRQGRDDNDEYRIRNDDEKVRVLVARRHLADRRRGWGTYLSGHWHTVGARNPHFLRIAGRGFPASCSRSAKKPRSCHPVRNLGASALCPTSSHHHPMTPHSAQRRPSRCRSIPGRYSQRGWRPVSSPQFRVSPSSSCARSPQTCRSTRGADRSGSGRASARASNSRSTRSCS